MKLIKCLKITLEKEIDVERKDSCLDDYIYSLCRAYDLNYINNITDDEYLYSVSVFTQVDDSLYSELQNAITTFAISHGFKITNSEFAEIYLDPSACIDQQFENN